MNLFSMIGVALLACALSGVGGFIKGNSHGRAVVQAEWDADTAKNRKAVDDANIAAQAAAELYEEAKAAQHTRVITVTREVSHALETAPSWRDGAIPDGVRLSLAAASADPAASQPDRAVPPAGPASASDQRGLGTGLRARLGWLGGLPSPTQIPR